MKLGFLGLGRMGAGMARNLKAAGHEVTVWNRSHEKSEALTAHGLRAVRTPAEAAAGAEVVFTMLADDRVTEEVVLGPQGVASALAKGALHIASGTIGVACARHLTAAHAERGQHYLSGCVFGRPEAADAAKLLVIAGGAKELIDRAMLLFTAIGRKTLIAGPEPWHANLVKISGNLTIISVIETLGEVMAGLKKAGVDPSVLYETLNELHGSPVYKNYGGMIVRDQFEPVGFALKLGLKDVRLMLQASDELEVPLPLASLIHDQLLAAMAHGQADHDWASLAKVSARNSGV